MEARGAWLAVGIGLVLLAGSGAAVAQGEGRLEPFEKPASQIARDINVLYYLILPISIVIGVLVEAFLLYAVLRYRAKPGKVEVTQEHERGHTKLEIAWTIPPAVILLIVGLLSAQTLGAIENPPTPDFEVKVTASQWNWKFTYPDGSSEDGALNVEVGRVVSLNVTATDVIHSLAVPAMGVKIDAIPGRVNRYWFQADEAGRFLVQCQEYCAGDHANMRATLVVHAKGECGTEGYCPEAVGGITDCDQATEADRIVPVRLVEGGGDPWSADPASFTARSSETLCIRVINPEGQEAPHNLTFIDSRGAEVAKWKPTLDAGEEGAIQHRFDPGRYTYFCAVLGHRELGMEGALAVS